MTATNLVSVGSYGEFEYWFAGIVVLAIMAFLVLGTLYILGLWPHHDFDVSNLTRHGGFMPQGVGAIFSSIVVVERRGARRVDLRRGLQGDGHPVRRHPHERSLPQGRAVLPQLGALHRLAHVVRAGRPHGGPARLITVNSRGVPVLAILASTIIGFLSVIAAYVSP